MALSGKGKGRALPRALNSIPTPSSNPTLSNPNLFSSEIYSFAKRKRIEDPVSRAEHFDNARKEALVNCRPKTKTHIPIRTAGMSRRARTDRLANTLAQPSTGVVLDSDSDGDLLSLNPKRFKVCFYLILLLLWVSHFVYSPNILRTRLRTRIRPCLMLRLRW